MELEQLRLLVGMVGREKVGCASASGGGTVDDKVGEDDERCVTESSPHPGMRLRGGKVTGRRERGRKETGLKGKKRERRIWKWGRREGRRKERRCQGRRQECKLAKRREGKVTG